MLASVQRGTERLALWLAALGAIIISVQAVWITYGVFVRYVLRSPDGMVTEVSASMPMK